MTDGDRILLLLQFLVFYELRIKVAAETGRDAMAQQQRTKGVG